MQFLVKASAFVDEKYVDARSGPVVLELNDDAALGQVSLTWDPLDEKAQDAQRRLIEERKDRKAKAAVEIIPELKPIMKPPVKKTRVDIDTLRAAQTAKSVSNTNVI